MLIGAMADVAVLAVVLLLGVASTDGRCASNTRRQWTFSGVYQVPESSTAGTVDVIFAERQEEERPQFVHG